MKTIILDYLVKNALKKEKAVGGLLDQPQPRKLEKSNTLSTSLRKKILTKLQSIENVSQKYPLTLTLNRRKKILDKPDREVHRYIQMRIAKNRSWKKLKYILFPEYDNNGKLHYHGVVWGTYQADLSNAVRFWRNTFGFVDKGCMKEIKYYICANYQKPRKKCSYILHGRVRSGCWYHYITKDLGKTGLWTLHKGV